MSYKGQVRRALESGHKVTPLMALREFGCMRLADVVFKLRNERTEKYPDGMPIITGKKTVNGKTFARYYLKGVEHIKPGLKADVA